MRIISGKHKGKTLRAPQSLPVRPTTDFAKEGLFNILENIFDLQQVQVLDLCSGTGNISFEFASRGASHVRCIDKNYHCISYIKKTAKELGLDQIEAFKNNCFNYLKHYDKQYDIIFTDPPYAMDDIELIPQLIFEKELLVENGWLIIEHDKRIDFSTHTHFLKHRKYGNVNFSFFHKKEL